MIIITLVAVARNFVRGEYFILQEPVTGIKVTYVLVRDIVCLFAKYHPDFHSRSHVICLPANGI